jgi:hypothetical protein
MNEPQRPVEWHKGFLEVFLKALEGIEKPQLEIAVKTLAPYATNCLEVVKQVGYTRLYDEYKPKYQAVGLLS